MQTTLEWISAEANKRVAIGIPVGVDAMRWNEIAHRTDLARIAHERALEEYVDHVIGCEECQEPARTATILRFSTPTRIQSH
jgi:hypothetical protein